MEEICPGRACLWKCEQAGWECRAGLGRWGGPSHEWEGGAGAQMLSQAEERNDASRYMSCGPGLGALHASSL